MYYFAYGSNLDLLQMQLRCPGRAVRVDGEARRLPHLPSRGNRSCAIAPSSASNRPRATTCGAALYELDGTDIARLDEREGYDKRRDRRLNQRNRITVRVEGSDERAVPAEVYIAVPTENPGLPSPHYVGYLDRFGRRMRAAEAPSGKARRAHAGAAAGGRGGLTAELTRAAVGR